MSVKVNTSGFDLAGAARKQKAALGLYADTAAKKMEAHAKSNAPWTDRTANARQSIEGDHFWRGDELVVRLSGGMEYSVYLELAHEKKYAILKPTIDLFAQETLAGYQKLVKD